MNINTHICIYYLHPGGAGLPLQPDWSAGSLPPHDTSSDKNSNKSREESVRKDEGRTALL